MHGRDAEAWMVLDDDDARRRAPDPGALDMSKLGLRHIAGTANAIRCCSCTQVKVARHWRQLAEHAAAAVAFCGFVYR